MIVLPFPPEVYGIRLEVEIELAERGAHLAAAKQGCMSLLRRVVHTLPADLQGAYKPTYVYLHQPYVKGVLNLPWLLN